MQPTDPPTTVTDTTLRWAIREPHSILPLHATSTDDLLVVDALFDSLTTWDQDLQPVPSAASSWHADDGGRVWTFSLQQGAAFHDGAPVRAADFAASWSAQARDGAAHHHLRDVVGYADVREARRRTLTGVQAVDDMTLRVELSRPVADFPAVAGHPALGPLPAAALGDPTIGEQPIGNGPFRMAEPWAHDRFVRLAAVDQPPDEQVTPRSADVGRPLAEVVFRIQDPASAYIAFQQGRIDVTDVPGGALDASEPPAEPRRSYEGPGLLRGRLASTYLLIFNTRRPPFDRIEVRQAVSLALDRYEIVRDAFEGNAVTGWNVVPSVVPGGRLRTCRRCLHSRETAAQMLRDAGVDRLTLWINEAGDHGLVAEEIRRDLAAVDVNVRVRAVPFDEFLEALRDGRRGLFRFGWTLDYPTMENALRPLFHSASTPERGGANYARYASGEVDALLDEAAAALDPARRTELFQRVEDQVLGRDQAVIPVATLRRRTAVADRVRDLVYGPLGTTDLTAVRVVERAPSQD